MLDLTRYQIAVIILIYLLPLLVMLVTYSLVGQRLWGSEIPGEASDHYQNQMQAKRKVNDASIYSYNFVNYIYSSYPAQSSIQLTNSHTQCLWHNVAKYISGFKTVLDMMTRRQMLD